ncbi:uncharacterized protein LOC128251161 [Octopus bimaculoides]|uniref:Uncharacterized protein n=1 Tax=Octopus bimaculoides TaxID=37653 RepID=A0A0L8HV98_OCTBM|nr:uncharacterized protein LOC128251161 [Octopus bimaculoides]
MSSQAKKDRQNTKKKHFFRCANDSDSLPPNMNFKLKEEEDSFKISSLKMKTALTYYHKHKDEIETLTDEVSDEVSDEDSQKLQKQYSHDLRNNRHKKGDQKKQEIVKVPSILPKAGYKLTIDECANNMKMLENKKDQFCSYLESEGLNKELFIQDLIHTINRLFKTNSDDYIVQKEVASFLEQCFDLYTNSNSFSHKTIVMQKPLKKFRPLSPDVPRTLNFSASDKDSPNTISNIVTIEGGIVTYSLHLMTLSCSTTDGDCNVVHSPSPVTDLTRVDKQTVMATIPFRKKIIIINPSSCQMKTFHCGFNKIFYVKNCTFLGIKLFSKTIYLVDWVHNTVESIFSLKDDPTNIAVGTNDSMLITFANINRIACYNFEGQQLFQLYSHSLTAPTDLTVYDNYFYVLQGNIIYKISSTGSVSQREIGIKARYFSVSTKNIFFSDYFGVGHVVGRNEDFWPRLTCSQQKQAPVLNNQIYIDDPYHIKKILPMTSSSVLVTYWNLKAILFADNGTKIWRKSLTFQFQPTDFCRLDSSSFLVLFKENRKIQYITCPADCPVLNQGPMIDVHAHYIQMCHIVSNKFLALTTEENKEVHILLVKENEVVIENKISLEHYDVSIAATPINFVVVIKKEHKLVFYSIHCKKLFERHLDFNGYPHHIFTNKIYFYVFYSRESIVICYDIYGEVKWWLQLPSATVSTIGVVKGTICAVDSNLHKILFYNYREWSNCCLHSRSPYIRNLNIRYSAVDENEKILISQIYHLPNRQVVVSDINSECLLYISKRGQVVHTFSLPSLATDICRWDSSQMGVTLPLEKELWIIGNLSKRVRIISLSHSYVKACKLSEGRIVCFCDKPYHLDIVSVQKHNQSEIISTVNIPFLIKSLTIENESLNLLIVAKKNIFVYNTSSKMGSSPLHSCFKAQHSLYGGCIDKKFIYLIDESRMFAINDHDLVVKDYVTNNQLNMSLDLLDVFSRKICVSEMLTSALYIEDLTVSDKAQEFLIPLCLGDKKPVAAECSVITENNLIAVYDRNNNSIKLVTFDGQLLDSIHLDVLLHHMCRWKSNTLVITTDTNQLLTLKTDFPLSFSTYQTEKCYNCIASLSDNLFVCDHGIERFEKYTLSVIHINERQSAIQIEKEIDLTGIKSSSDFSHITVIANDIIVVCGDAFTYFLNSDGERLHSFNHLFPYNCMTNDGIYVYIPMWNATSSHTHVVCLSQTGEYKKIFLNKKRSECKFYFNNINCNGPRFAGNNETSLYVEGLFKLNREKFHVCRLQTDLYSVQVKDIDISVDGKTVVIEKANPGNVKMFQRNGRLLCHTNLGTTLGGVCFSEKYIMVTAPDREEIFQLNRDLTMHKIWQSLVPYGVIWRKVKNIYWCAHINLTEYHAIQIDNNKLNVLESVSLLKFGSILHFPSSKVQADNKKFSHEQSKELENSESGGTSEDIIYKGRLKVRCGNYIAYSMSGSDQVAVRSLPHRTTMFPLPLTTFGEEEYRMYRYIKPVVLQNNAVVFLFKNTLTMTTTEGHVIQQRKINKVPQDICCWTAECFVVVFHEEKQLMFFKEDLSLLKTIDTKRNYNMIYKKNENQLVCACDVKSCRINSYVDVLNINDETCDYSQKIIIEDKAISAIGVTSSEDIIVIKDKKVQCVVCWYRGGGDLVRSLTLPLLKLPFQGISERPLTIHGENVFIADLNKDIYQVSLYSKCQTLLSSDDIEVRYVMALFASNNSLVVIGALGDNTCCFFNYER